ncbi:DUF4352 domain-containing protein [Chengkuizengella axinellae]|uniref:DUF4352 domain-containing protein n=1 Tax=Chengkuizengella axinellae TaxID=3064388 RepID=A0ABT9IWF2_9BACL|nr:DUF4352 domain-containing protein [Chengkuizengella sp. 2205SS18-9]MDP5273663.1 DUF4352 domain-containing protein [Chengkuizengella sp. 2205SS18-9]
MKRNFLLLCFVIIPLSLSIGCSREVLSRDEEVSIKDWSYAIDSSSNSNGVNGAQILDIRTNSPYGEASPGSSHFIVIDLLINNEINKPITVDGHQFELIDGKGNIYEIYNPEESLKSIKINPKLNEFISLTYKVPDDIEQEIKLEYGNSNKLLLIGDYEFFLTDTMF